MGSGVMEKLVCLIFLSGTYSHHWSSTIPHNTIKYECSGGTSVLPWAVQLAPGEEIDSVHWVFEGRSGMVPVAAFFADTFVVPLPPYAGRITSVSNAGIALSHVTEADAGNYSVEFMGRDSSGDSFTLRRAAKLVVLDNPDGLTTTDRHLHASQEPAAVFSNTTHDWHVVLSCGKSSYNSHPPFTMEWITPSGQVVPSSYFKDGQFFLVLDNPVSRETYTCFVIRNSTSAPCFHGNSTNSGNATITVDRVEARLALLEAENNEMKEKLRSAHATNTQQLPTFQGSIPCQQLVSFHARGLLNYQPLSGSALVFPTVINNHGNGYDPATGIFTAVSNGTYCFLASLLASSPHSYISVTLMVNDEDVAYTYAKGIGDSESASLQAVVQLGKGQKVWLGSDSGSTYLHTTPCSASFTGFLISTGC